MATSRLLTCASTESSRTRSMPSARRELNFITGPPYTLLDVDADRSLQKKGGQKNAERNHGGSCARHRAGASRVLKDRADERPKEASDQDAQQAHCARPCQLWHQIHPRKKLPLNWVAVGGRQFSC